jgi:c-di-GMP-binding flagellar brake protein YcgR
MIDHEQRQYPRVVLNVDDGYFGNFLLSDNTAFVASIVNLSAGGVNLSMPEEKKSLVNRGDLMLLRNIAGAAQLSFVENIKTEIRWIDTFNGSPMISVGCRFQDIGEKVLEQMIEFVNSERVVRGQYK